MGKSTSKSVNSSRKMLWAVLLVAGIVLAGAGYFAAMRRATVNQSYTYCGELFSAAECEPLLASAREEYPIVWRQCLSRNTALVPGGFEAGGDFFDCLIGEIGFIMQ